MLCAGLLARLNTPFGGSVSAVVCVEKVEALPKYKEARWIIYTPNY